MNDILSLLGKKGAAEVLLLLLGEKKNYTTIADESTVSSRTLSRRLKELEESGLVSREILQDRRVRYSLTEKGATATELVKKLLDFER